MNRLTEAQYINVGNYTLVDYPTEIEDYTTQNILYDKNGNLIRLHRTGLTAANTIDRIDMLNYTYLPNSNRLKAVADEADIVKGFRDDTNNNTMDYDYDLNGNMTKDLNKGIGTQSTKGITYNHLNLPVQVTFSGSQTGTVNYIYDATGAKMQKKVVDNGNVTVTDYANRFIYENGVLKSFSHPEGYVRVPEPDNDEYHPDKFDYIYQYKDHLGNVRLSYADANGNGLIDDAQQFNDGFESQSGWTSDTDSQYTAWNLSDYDSYNTHTGNYSGRIDNPGSTEKFVHSSYWMPINNSVATQYTFSAWVYSDGPTADLYLFMKEQGEDDYYTLVAYAVTPAGVRGQWVKIQATVSVPAHIKKLNLRIDNNGGGTVWFDDVELKKTSGTTGSTSEIIEENNYYAFGMKHEGYNNVAVSSDPALKYKYNGKELQDELNLNWYDYQARNYDPSLGRWSNIDPLAEQMRRFSPYTYCYNNPIYFIDPDGMQGLDWYKNKNTGKVKWIDGNKSVAGYQHIGYSYNDQSYGKDGTDNLIMNGTTKQITINGNVVADFNKKTSVTTDGFKVWGIGGDATAGNGIDTGDRGSGSIDAETSVGDVGLLYDIFSSIKNGLSSLFDDDKTQAPSAEEEQEETQVSKDTTITIRETKYTENVNRYSGKKYTVPRVTISKDTTVNKENVSAVRQQEKEKNIYNSQNPD
ncbi:hypothetical protein GWA97_10125 [Flavobacterium sp. LaA7.5]|nr:hypothetical protein [Flavobacterium salilacus subsp. altitudinum]